MRTGTAVLLIGLLGTVGCEEDPQISLDVHAVTLDAGDVLVTVMNDGEITGELLGCPSGPVTIVEHWDDTQWKQIDVRNADCEEHETRTWSLAPREDVNWAVNMAAGRYRFSVDLVEGRIGVVRGTSNPVDVLNTRE